LQHVFRIIKKDESYYKSAIGSISRCKLIKIISYKTTIDYEQNENWNTRNYYIGTQ